MQSHCWGEHCPVCSTHLALHCSHTVGVNTVQSVLLILHCIAVTLLGWTLSSLFYSACLHCMQSHCWGEHCPVCSTQLACIACNHTVGVNTVQSVLLILHCIACNHTVGVNTVQSVLLSLLALHAITLLGWTLSSLFYSSCIALQSHCWGEHCPVCFTHLALHCSHTVGVNTVQSVLLILHCIAVTLLGWTLSSLFYLACIACNHTVGVNTVQSVLLSLHCVQSHCWGEHCPVCST